MKKRTYISALLMSGLLLSTGFSVTSCKDYDDDISALQNKDSNYDSQLKALNDFKTSTDAAINEANSKIADLQKNAITESKVNELAQAAAEKAANQAKSDMADELKKELAALDFAKSEDVKALATKIAGLDDSLNKLTTSVNDQQKAITDMNVQLKALQNFQKEIEALNLKETLAGLDTKITNATAAIGKVKTDLEAKVDADVDAVRKAMEAADKALKDELTAEIAKKADVTAVNTLHTLLAKRLTSAQIVPTLLDNGINTLAFETVSYKRIWSANDGSAQVAKRPSSGSGIAMPAWLNIRLNPSGVALDGIKSDALAIVTHDAVSRAGVDEVNPDDQFSIDFSRHTYEGNILSFPVAVKSGFNDELVKDVQSGHIISAAVKIPLADKVLTNDEKTTGANVYTDYAQIASDAVTSRFYVVSTDQVKNPYAFAVSSQDAKDTSLSLDDKGVVDKNYWLSTSTVLPYGYTSSRNVKIAQPIAKADWNTTKKIDIKKYIALGEWKEDVNSSTDGSSNPEYKQDKVNDILTLSADRLKDLGFKFEYSIEKDGIQNPIPNNNVPGDNNQQYIKFASEADQTNGIVTIAKDGAEGKTPIVHVRVVDTRPEARGAVVTEAYIRLLLQASDAQSQVEGTYYPGKDQDGDKKADLYATSAEIYVPSDNVTSTDDLKDAKVTVYGPDNKEIANATFDAWKWIPTELGVVPTNEPSIIIRDNKWIKFNLPYSLVKNLSADKPSKYTAVIDYKNSTTNKAAKYTFVFNVQLPKIALGYIDGVWDKDYKVITSDNHYYGQSNTVDFTTDLTKAFNYSKYKNLNDADFYTIKNAAQAEFTGKALGEAYTDSKETIDNVLHSAYSYKIVLDPLKDKFAGAEQYSDNQTAWPAATPNFSVNIQANNAGKAFINQMVPTYKVVADGQESKWAIDKAGTPAQLTGHVEVLFNGQVVGTIKDFTINYVYPFTTAVDDKVVTIYDRTNNKQEIELAKVYKDAIMPVIYNTGASVKPADAWFNDKLKAYYGVAASWGLPNVTTNLKEVDLNVTPTPGYGEGSLHGIAKVYQKATNESLTIIYENTNNNQVTKGYYIFMKPEIVWKYGTFVHPVAVKVNPGQAPASKK